MEFVVLVQNTNMKLEEVRQNFYEPRRTVDTSAIEMKAFLGLLYNVHGWIVTPGACGCRRPLARNSTLMSPITELNI